MPTFSITMAQIKDDDKEDGPHHLDKEIPKVTPDPGPPLPTTTPEEDAESMAQQWMGQMTRIGPDLYVEDKTASLLSALKALGLPMASKQDVLTVAGLFIDDSVLTEHIAWFNDDEWMKLIQWLQKLPAKVSTLRMVDLKVAAPTDNAQLDLLMSLHDLQFEIAPDSPKTQTLLAMLARGGGQASALAQQILSLDPASKAALFGKVDTAAYGVTQQAPAAPAAPARTPTPPHGVQTMNVQDLQEPKQTLPPAPMEEMTVNPNTPLNVSIPLPKGGRGGNKGFQYVLDNFQEVCAKLAAELPEINWAPLGAEVAGIMPPSKTQGNELTEMARAGNLVRVYDGGWTGMVLGSTEDGRLVLTNAAGELVSTDPEAAEVRVNANGQLKLSQ